LTKKVDVAAEEWRSHGNVRKLWQRDKSLWTGADEDRWLGWLDAVAADRIKSYQAFAEEIRRDGFADALLLGMGGSSLGPDVLRNTFGPVKGHPTLHVLDTTDPASILALRARIDPADTLFIVASKSGATTETLSHQEYFWEQVEATGTRKPERNFAVITDPGTPLEKQASRRDYRWIFLNPPDIGGRYSVLSYFGLVPAALMGADVKELLERAQEMAHSCDASVPVETNPAVWLGAVLGTLARNGHDKLTLVTTPRVATFGYWVEQLIAESTGKHGAGIVPVEGERLGKPEVYGDDRLFVYIRMDRDPDNRAIQALERAGQPVVTLTLRDPLDLGGEFLRWELATAVAGSVLGIDPFDQPNVQESKDNTKKVLADFRSKGRLPAAVSVTAAEAGPEIARLLRAGPPGSYFAIMSYTQRTAGSEGALSRIRTHVRDATRFATTSGYGPRFLHSTGQLHKGGPRTGIFLQVVQEDSRDVPIPGEPYGFSTLKQAQALGDLKSLQSRKIPVLRVNLGKSPAAGWKALARSVESAVK